MLGFESTKLYPQLPCYFLKQGLTQLPRLHLTCDLSALASWPQLHQQAWVLLYIFNFPGCIVLTIFYKSDDGKSTWGGFCKNIWAILELNRMFKNILTAEQRYDNPRSNYRGHRVSEVLYQHSYLSPYFLYYQESSSFPDCTCDSVVECLFSLY